MGYMERKTIFLDLSSEMVDRIDRQNDLGDRSNFISNLLDKQLQRNVDSMGVSTELTTIMGETGGLLGVSGELNLINSSGFSLGKFDINTPDGFEHLVEKIGELSEDTAVQMRARNLR